MTTEITEPIAPPSASVTDRLDEQKPSVEALLSLIEMFGHLPKPYITIHTPRPTSFDLQLDHPSAFEAWRTALQLPADSVTLHASGGSVWLSTLGVFRGVPFNLSGFEVPLTREQALTQPAVSP